jgi:branched-chain amino acid transport system substrate-binding protein
VHRFRLLATLTAALALVVAGCASGDDDTATTEPADENAGTNDEPAEAPKAETVGNDWALAYTGGTDGAADPNLDPIVIGYINQEGGVPAFPEATVGLEAAVEYANEELGGIEGHPLEIAKCIVQVEEDGQRCATEMLNNDDVSFVMTGVLVVGNGSVYSVLDGKKPVFVGFPAVAADFVAADAFAFTPGAVGVVKGLATFVGEHLDGINSVAIVHSNNDAGKAGAESFLKPGLNAYGIQDVTTVPVDDTATAPELASAIQAAGGDTADLFIPLLTVQGCAATYDALQSLGVQPRVVTTGLCYGTPMTSHLSDLGLNDPVPDGWYYADLGYSYFMPDDESGMSTYLENIAQYAGEDAEYTGYAGPLFANLLTSAKFLNAIGAENVTADAVREQARGFEGPMMLVAGPMKCGFDPVFKSICGQEMGVQRYESGEWTSVANALNGQAINVATAAG